MVCRSGKTPWLCVHTVSFPSLNSATAPAGWPSVPAGQRRDALNVSFSLIDLGGAPDGRELASNPTSSGRARCEALYKGHTGSTTINGDPLVPLSIGYLRVNTLANGGLPSSVGASGTAASNLVIGPAGGIQYVGTGGSTNREIAEALYLSPLTVKTHVSRILTKLRARDRVQLVVIAYQAGLVSP